MLPVASMHAMVNISLEEAGHAQPKYCTILWYLILAYNILYPPTFSEHRACQNPDRFFNPQSSQSSSLSAKLTPPISSKRRVSYLCHTHIRNVPKTVPYTQSLHLKTHLRWPHDHVLFQIKQRSVFNLP